MKSSIEFAVTPTIDAPGTLLVLHFDDRRYLIGNLCEGTVRACLQHGIALKKVTDVLLSGRTRWSGIGGSLGLLLTLASIKQVSAEAKKINEEPEGLRFHGAPNLNYAFATARRFIFRNGMPIQATEYRAREKPELEQVSNPSWEDSHIRVWAIPTLPMGHQSTKPATADVENINVYSKIVSDMFNSTWRSDRLVPVRLPQVAGGGIFLRDAHHDRFVPYTGPRPGAAGSPSFSIPDIEVWQREPWPASKSDSIPPTEPSHEAMSYIVKTHSVRGKFQTEKALKLKVPKGRLYSQLAQGQSVQNTEGATITPEMVLGPSQGGTGFAFIEIPSADYIDSTLAQPHWGDVSVMEGVGGMVWSLGAGLASDARIRSFQDRFSGMKHIVSAPDFAPDDFVLDTMFKTVLRQNRVSTAAYPLLQADTQKTGLTSALSKEKLDDKVAAQRGLQFWLQPKMQLDVGNATAPISLEATAKAVDEDYQLLGDRPESLFGAVDESKHVQWRSSCGFEDAEIITLGTGSSQPGTHRNVSGTLVRVPGDGSFLLDAGEGTLGSLRRLYSAEELQEVLMDLKMIWISHLHADHHLGLTSVIKAWYEARYDAKPADGAAQQDVRGEEHFRLPVVSHVGLIKWLHEYASVEDFGYSRVLPLQVTSANTVSSNGGSRQRDEDTVTPLLQAYSVDKIETVYVSHCYGAQAIAITTKSGFKFSYSGDCRPSQDFANIGADSHVLIHESTFEDDMRDEALKKKHSTAGEALSVALAMRAKLCVLTHFSQRYPKMPHLASLAQKAKLASRAGEAASKKASVAAAADDDDDDDDDEVPAMDDGDEMIEVPGKLPTRPPPQPALSPQLAQIYDDAILHGHSAARTGDAGMCVIMAFDFMRLRLRDAPELERRQPVLRVLYERLTEADERAKARRVADLAREQEQVRAERAGKADKAREKAERRAKNKAEARGPEQAPAKKQKTGAGMAAPGGLEKSPATSGSESIQQLNLKSAGS